MTTQEFFIAFEIEKVNAAINEVVGLKNSFEEEIYMKRIDIRLKELFSKKKELEQKLKTHINFEQP